MSQIKKGNPTIVKLNFVGGYNQEHISKIPESGGIAVAFECGPLDTNTHMYPCLSILGVFSGKNIQEEVRKSKNAWDNLIGVGNSVVFCYDTIKSEQFNFVEDITRAIIVSNDIKGSFSDEYSGKSGALLIECEGAKGILKSSIFVV